MKRTVEAESLRECIALAVKTARERAGLAQGDAAKRAKCTQATLSRYESGALPLSVHLFWQLCELYGARPHHVLRSAERRWRRVAQGEAKQDG